MNYSFNIFIKPGAVDKNCMGFDANFVGLLAASQNLAAPGNI